MKLDDEAKKKGLIASSAGNHAQGVAYAAKKLGVKATICMPAHTRLNIVDASKAHGADVVLYGEAYDEAYANYDFVLAFLEILNYFTNTLSSFYMDFTKDI